MIFRNNLPRVKSKIRFLNGTSLNKEIGIYVDENLVVESMKFADITDYKDISPGLHVIKVYNKEDPNKPILEKRVDIAPNSNYTLSIVDVKDALDNLLLKDGGEDKIKINSHLRFINLSKNAPLMSLSLLNDIVLFDNVEYIETTNYYNLSSAIYNFKITFLDNTIIAKTISNKVLENGKFYTIYVLGLLNGNPPLGYIMVEDEYE
ncbi:DUF4397 domain-containing protein [Clostridium sp.]|uniref:DUF4397 domain-containing protein n=1 Tax=Clostridium sp. TaxID=1506 RepID=UPI002613BF8A|nr:DUF4397 domain-containing protein [Clostridium sp.]